MPKTFTIRLKGGPGSGHFGHKGIPGHRGGSLPRGESSQSDVKRPMRYTPKDYEEVKNDIIGIGYEQQDSNAEGSVDFEDALRIYSDRHDGYDFSHEPLGKLEEAFSAEFNRTKRPNPKPKPQSFLPVRASARNPVYGGSLYRMPREDRPSMGVHGGYTYLTDRGSKIVNFIRDNEAEFTEFATKHFGINGKWTVKTAVDYASQVSDYGEGLGTLASHEASGNFGDIASLYTAYAISQKYKVRS